MEKSPGGFAACTAISRPACDNYHGVVELMRCGTVGPSGALGKLAGRPYPPSSVLGRLSRAVVANGYALFILASCGPDFSSPLAAGGEGWEQSRP